MPEDTLEAQLLKKATSIGPEPMSRENLSLGMMPVPGLQGAGLASSASEVGSPFRKICDLLLSRAMGTAYDHLPPAKDLIPGIANKFLPAGQHFPLSTDTKLDK